MKYEYNFIRGPGLADVHSMVQEAGSQGWRLKHFESHATSGGTVEDRIYIAIMERPL